MADRTISLVPAADTDANFERLGLTRGDIQAWEDGARTDERRRPLRMVAFRRPPRRRRHTGRCLPHQARPQHPGGPLAPTIMLNLDLPDGTSRQLRQTFDITTWSADTDRADVRIGAHRFTGSSGSGVQPRV